MKTTFHRVRMTEDGSYLVERLGAKDGAPVQSVTLDSFGKVLAAVALLERSANALTQLGHPTQRSIDIASDVA